MRVQIAEPQAYDLPALRELYLQVRQAAFTWFDTSHYMLTPFDTDTVDEYTLVAYVDNEIAGFVSIYKPDNFIHHLYVQQDYQNQGVGKLLLDEMLAKMDNRASLKCLIANIHAIDFYTRYGFKQKKKGISSEGIYVLMEYAEVK